MASVDPWVAGSFAVLVTSATWSTAYGGLILSAAILGHGCYWLTMGSIPGFAEKLKARGFSGVDLNKSAPKDIANIRSGYTDQATALEKIPEAVGIVPAFIYLMGGILSYTLLRSADILYDSPAAIHFNACLLTISVMTFLGFVDDVLDLRWRYKVILPLLAAIPALVAYHGPTSVYFPRVLMPIYNLLRPYLSLLGFFETSNGLKGLVAIDFTWFYYVYMTLLSCLCSNAVNIYAGINGLEAGQSLITTTFIAIHNVIEIQAHKSQPQCLSLILQIIFFNVTLALFFYNRYPARVFVGDTYTMLAGVHFGSTAILGHFSKTLLLLFIPQLLNAIYSIPQLLGIVKCPRHRVPHFDPKTQKLVSSRNLTLINLALDICGPMTERNLTRLLLTVQVLCCIVGLGLRYSPAYRMTFL